MNQSLNASARTAKNDDTIIVGLDIGTTKIAAIAGRRTENGKLEILGFGQSPSNGVQHGQVLNINQTIQSINNAIANCKKSNPDLTIDEVYVGIAGQHIHSLQTRGELVRDSSENEIAIEEIEELINNQRKTFIPAGDQIIDVIPQDFNVDGMKNIKDPVGYNGVKIGANFHIITGDKNAIRNINRAVQKSELKIKDLVLQPLASAAAVMSDIDMEAGVAILDIGGGTSDLAVYYEGVLKHTAVIPFGGENITNDIKQGLGVLKQQAEAMKKQFGCALADVAKANTYITIPGLRGMAPRQISIVNLANIIQARMTEILEFVTYNLRQIGFDHRMLTGGIIITGGGSQLGHLLQLTEYVTGLSARIGYPNEHLAPNHIDILKHPMYATCLGLILKGFDDQDHNRKKPEFPTEEKVYSPKVAKPVTTIVEQEKEVTQVATSKKVEIEKEGPNRITKIFDNLKTHLIDLFKEEEETTL